MSQKAIREYDGKRMLSKWFEQNTKKTRLPDKFVSVTSSTNFEQLAKDPANSWLLTEKLVVKPDQLIKRRGKAGLLGINLDYQGVQKWINERMNKEVQVESVKGVLNTFIIETFCPHNQVDEYYVSMQSVREGDQIYFYHEGGVDVGDVDAKAQIMVVPTDSELTLEKITEALLPKVPNSRQRSVARFIKKLFSFYAELNYAYLEINPLVVKEDVRSSPSRKRPKLLFYPLDIAAKVDQTADFECAEKWGKLEYPAPFGRGQTPEEEFIASLDAKTGASLKLTILNPEGRIWTMVAGGGASVVYADTISDLGFGKDLANYGEYSGDPSEGLTFEYAKTVLDLMTRKKNPQGKVLIIGGGIANFTNVAETFKGIIRAINQFKDKLIDHQVKVYVRRGGPNYQQGLKMMKACGHSTGVHIEVYGPETHLTSVVKYALLGQKPPVQAESSGVQISQESFTANGPSKAEPVAAPGTLFTSTTTSIIYGLQPSAVQNMLDFDHVCSRKNPSVVAMIYPFGGNHFQKFYWGAKEILIPVYQKMSEAVSKHPQAEVLINFASFRSVFPSVNEALEYPNFKTIAIIAEGVPERRTKSLIKKAHEKGVVIIGPATVGGIKPGCFRIGNTGGMIDNIISSKLWRAGSVAYISRSGGMSNELNNIVSRNTNGVYEGIAIGGDRYPGTTFLDHLLRFEKDPQVKILVLLGEVGGVDEYDVCQAIKEKKITKPMVGWCMGTCAKIFPYEVQFGHAGALARGKQETSEAKNQAMREAGIFVPNSFDEFGSTLKTLYETLVREGKIVPQPEAEVPTIPMDYSWAQKLGLIRKPTSFMTTISDERGDELMYSGVPISTVLQEDLGIGGVISLLWFKRRLPKWATRFIEMILMLTADHGPAVSGAHNAIVTARAGKDLISSLVSGLMTIGPRFGGAIDGAAQQFSSAFDRNLSPKDFVNEMKDKNELISGIGHKVKSLANQDKRVVILKEYAFKEFPKTDLLNYAIEVEKITSAKKENLILNVDGAIGTCFVDLLRHCGAFTLEEANTYINLGCLNGLFVVGRSIGFIGHYLDQVRLKQPLYRHPWEDIAFVDDFGF